jgi:hypothetical protein
VRPGHPDPWVPPWTPGLEQIVCVGQDCRLKAPRLIVAITATRGHCASCAERLGLRDEPVVVDVVEQLSLGL